MTNTIQISPDVPFGTPTHVNLLALLLRQHKGTLHHGASGSWITCACTPQITRREMDHQQHVAEILMQRMVDQIELELRVVETDKSRAEGLLCNVVSAVGSQCSLVNGHNGRHRSVYGSTWDDESDRRTADTITRSLDRRRD